MIPLIISSNIEPSTFDYCLFFDFLTLYLSFQCAFVYPAFLVRYGFFYFVGQIKKATQRSPFYCGLFSGLFLLTQLHVAEQSLLPNR